MTQVNSDLVLKANSNDFANINSNLAALSNKFILINMTSFRANFNTTTNRIMLEFYRSSTEMYSIGFNVTTKEIILESIINGVYNRVWTIS